MRSRRRGSRRRLRGLHATSPPGSDSAATYDRLRRFDLADRAYAQAIKISGVNVTILNNRGYSYLLRGDVVNARKQFTAAYNIDPSNPTVINNLHLLDGSKQYVRRVEGAY